MKVNRKVVIRRRVNLPHGAVGEIARRAGVSISMVSKVIHFKARSKKVEEEVSNYFGVPRESIFGNGENHQKVSCNQGRLPDRLQDRNNFTGQYPNCKKIRRS